MGETKPKKMVSRNVAIALGIICIILIGLIAYFSIIGISAQNSYNNLQNQNKQLQANNTNLQSQVHNLTNIVNLADSIVVAKDTTVTQGDGAYSDFSLSASYAGYVSVYVLGSTVNGTWVEVSYSSYGVNYNQEITVNVGYSAVFPVLPSSNITVGVGNGLSFVSILLGETETVTITYYY